MTDLPQIKIGIVDPCGFYLYGLKETLNQLNQPINFAKKRPDLLQNQLKYHPYTAILILALEPLKANPSQVIQHLTQIQPNLQILGILSATDKCLIQQYMEAGIHGLIHRYDGDDEIKEALKKLGNSESYFSPQLSQSFHEHIKDTEYHQTCLKNLYDFDISFIRFLSWGYTNEEIADRLSKSPRTLEKHRLAIKEKLNCRTLTEIGVFAAKHGLV